MSHALRLRRALSLSTALLSPTRRTTVVSALSDAGTILNQSPATTISAVRNFHSTQHLSSSYAQRSFNDIDKIDPDMILFEGCDYNHFLIVMDFGKDARPPPDQMIETYIQTCARVVGSVEEAKKKIYACSTTTYTGFQVEVDEETSKKFEGLPGVTFVLPDSYIDPVNKVYGGDQFINGEIIPRPPPAQYNQRPRRVTRDDQRPRDPMPNQQGNSSLNQQGNRAYNQQGNPPYNQQGNPPYIQQGNPPYNQPGSMPQGGRGYPPQGPQQDFQQRQSYPSQQSYPPQQSYPSQQNYGPSRQADRGTPMHPPMPAPVPPPIPGGGHYADVGKDGFQGGQRNFVPSQEGNYNRDYNHPQGHMSNQPGNHGGYASPGQYRSDSGNYALNQPEVQRGNHPGGHGGYGPPGQMVNSGDNRSSFSSPVTAAYGQPGAGNFEQNEVAQYRQVPSGNNYGHGAGYTPLPPVSNEQGYPSGHGFNSPGAQTGFNQGRY